MNENEKKEKVSKPAAEVLANTQTDTYEYVDWLYNTGRLTAEEHSILVSKVVDLVMAAQAFGYSGESA